MGIFNVQSILELQVNGQTVDDNDEYNVGGEDTGNEPAPAAENNEPADNAGSEENDDYTLEEDNPSDNDEGSKKDDQKQDDNKEESDDNYDVGEEESTDDKGDSEGEEEGSKEGEGEENPDKSDKKDDTPDEDAEDDEKKAAEEAIYNSLTDDQKRIRILQLKLDYKDLYETMVNTIDGVNQINKTTDNLETIKRLNILLSKAKSILISYIDINFDKNTYIENYAAYLKFIAIFRTVSKVIEDMNKKDK